VVGDVVATRVDVKAERLPVVMRLALAADVVDTQLAGEAERLTVITRLLVATYLLSQHDVVSRGLATPAAMAVQCIM